MLFTVKIKYGFSSKNIKKNLINKALIKYFYFNSLFYPGYNVSK